MAKSDAQMRWEWADAFAMQSRSDFGVYLALPVDVEECHRLHYLQMAGEKIAKAYLLRDTGAALENAMTSHIAFGRFANIMLRTSSATARYQGKDAWLQQTVRRVRGLAREIEKLAPSVDRQQSPANVEYSWAEGESIVIPCRHFYPVTGMLREPGGAEFLGLLQEAIDGYFSTQPA